MDGLRRLLEALQHGEILPLRDDPLLNEGLKQLRRAVRALLVSPTLHSWSRSQLDQVLTTLNALVSSSAHLPAGEAYIPTLEGVFALTVEFCVHALESFAVRSRGSPYNEQVQRKVLLLLEAATVEGKAERSSRNSLRDVSSEFLLELASAGEEDESKASSTPKERASSTSSEQDNGENILAVLSSEKTFLEGCDEEPSKERGQTMVNVCHHHAVVRYGCVQRLSGLCRGLLAEHTSDYETDGVGEKLGFATRVLLFLVDLTRTSPYRAFVEETVAEVVKMACSLSNILKLSRDVESLDSDEGTSGDGSLPLFMDALLLFSEALSPPMVLTQNLRTFLAASIIDKMDAGKMVTPSGMVTGSLVVASTPQVVNYFLRLLQADQFHASDGRFAFRRQHSGDDLGSASGSGQECQLRSEVFMMNEVRRQSGHLQAVFPHTGDWLDKLISVSAVLHAHGLRLRPLAEVVAPSAAHSEEDSATISMDSVTVASEDDALFGDLFSESGRHSVNSEETMQITCAKKVGGVHIGLLQTACQVLSFLKNYVFLPDWHRPTFETARDHVSKEHLGVLLGIHHSQAAFVSKNLDVNADQSLLVDLHRCSFDVLFALVDRAALSDDLQVHLFRQILKDGSSHCSLSRNILALLGKLLIVRGGNSASNDPLVLEFWKTFSESVLSKARSAQATAEADMERITAVLPSRFYLELLFMAFHSVDVTGRSTIVQNVVASLSSCRLPVSASASLTFWSLLVSRLVMAVKYVISHFHSFPKWLVVELTKKLRYERPETPLTGSSKDGPFPSWAAVFGRRILDGPSDECIQQLFDVPTVPTSPADLDLGLGLDLKQLQSVLCDLLEAWTGKVVKSTEELILERYLFLLSWDVLQFGSSGLQPSVPWKHSASTTMQFWLELSGSISAGLDDDGAEQWAEFFIHSYSNLEVSLQQGRINLASWDLLRQGGTLALLLLPLEAGLKKGGTEQMKDVVNRILDNGLVLQSLSSVLRWYVDAANSISRQKPAVNLILRACLSEKKRHELLEKAGASTTTLKSLLRWGSSTSWRAELRAVLVDAGVADLDSGYLNILLHGFPLTSAPGDAGLVSCMLSIESLLEVITRILKSGGSSGFSTSDKLVETVLSMKVSSVYDSLGPRCDSVLESVVVRKEDRRLYSDVFLLKHMEELLNLVCTSEGMSADVREAVVVQAVELFVAIKSDADRCPALDVRFSSGSESEQSEKAESELFSSDMTDGSLSPFVDVLDGFFRENVNVKVMQFFVDVLESPSSFQATFRQHLQAKFLSMDKGKLAAWFEQRFLGCAAGSGAATEVQLSSSVPVRDAAVRFMQAVLGSAGSEAEKKELAAHVLDAVLMNLEKAFVQYDASSARSYFSCATQLLKGEQHLKKVSGAVIDVLARVPTDSGHLEGLKCLLSFLSSMLMACGAQKVLSQRFGKSKTSTGTPAASALKARVARRASSEQALHLTESAAAADDMTSVDEDEDDATSDGEMTSLDREEDEDVSNSERFLASKVCTFTSSGSNFMEQHWYFCYTCDLTVSKGCCSVCAKVCHRGHKVVYSRLSRFFCDCGAGGVRGSNCLCLKPRKYTSSSATSAPPPPKTASAADVVPVPVSVGDPDRLQLSDSDSETDSDEYKSEGFELQVSDQEERRLLELLAELKLETELLSLSRRLLASLNLGKDPGGKEEIQLGSDKVLEFKSDMFQLRRSYKSGSFDMKIKAEYSNSRELRSHLLNGSLSKSLLTVSSRGRLAAGEGDKVMIYDVGQFIGQPTSMPVVLDKSSMKNLSRNAVRFELVHLVFNAVNESYLAVAGYEDCLIFTVNTRGEVTDRLALELALQDAHIRRISWIPGSQVELMVVTNKFVKIFDLSSDKISPMHYFTILEDQIVDAALLLAGQGQLLVLVLSQRGLLFSQRISRGADSGARILTDVVPLPDQYKPSRGVSLHYCSYLKLLFTSFNDGLTLICRLGSEATVLSEISAVVEPEGEKTKPAGFHHWRDVFDGSGLFACLSSQKSNAATVVHIGTTDVQAQHMRASGSSLSVRVDGIASYRSMTKDRSHVLILHDDGSLQVLLYVPTAVQGAPVAEVHKPTTSVASEQLKKIGAVLLGNRSISAPSFPLDFFERTICITPEVKFGGDILRNTDSDAVKVSLAQDDGFVESPSASGFKILVTNTNPDMVMVGCRVHVGNTSASHIPSEIRVFQRSIKLEEGVRSWYDIPFANSEALLTDEEFAVTIGSTYNGTSLPRIDNLEIYGRSKEEFGWKEKLDAVLDLESQHLPNAAAASRKRRLQTASTLEQVFHETFRVLCGYYSLSRLHSSDFNVEKCKSVCSPVLEAIFESDRQSLLQSAGRRVLRALSPSKDAYYQAKDIMSLSGVARACPFLASKLSFGGNRIPWIVQEFSSQVRTVCKISLHRPANLATYLERNGPSIVEELVSVLWEILLCDNLDQQTVNDLVVLTVDLIYGYAECLSAHVSTASLTPAVNLLQKLLFAPYDAVRSSCSLAISSRLLQVPLPKQTMLAMDDGGDNSRTNSVQSEGGASTVVSGSQGQVLLEEDTGTASVQYCCDGCSTVPILRRRWHCNVCPDFDLCETCFELVDGDQLPPPHTRDHPMSAIPIEAETSAENQENQFQSLDDMSEESLLQMATELSLQSTAPSLTSAMETNDEYTEIVETKTGSISASKSMVNSLLLRGLLENLRGWTQTNTGTVALPVMQLFYRLATASSTQFESSGGGNLEKLVKSLLEELDFENCINVKSRSNGGEMIILIFMFFTLLLRYWHQPGSPHSGGSGAATAGHDEYDRACAALRQQSLVKYVLNITQQLSQVFKSSSRGAADVTGSGGGGGAPCGALLTVRREFAAGSFTPFFSDSYAKSHRGDLFAEFHKLLLESAFRLAYSLVRPGKSEKSSEKEQPSKGCPGAELKLDSAWQDVLCGYINNTHTSFVRKYSRRLLLHMCGSKYAYYNARDQWQLTREVKKLYKLVQKSGGLHSVIPYERSVKLLKCLTLIGEVATSRPRNWQKYCTRHPEVLPFLLSASFSFAEELVVQTLKLLALVFYFGQAKKESSDSGNKPESAKKEKDDPGSDKGFLDMEQAVDQLFGEENLKNFLDSFLLEWNAMSVRSEAKAVMSGAWHHGGHPFKVCLLTLLLERVPLLPAYGQNVQEFNELLSWLLKKGTQELAANNQETVLIQGCLTGNVIKKVFETLRLQNELLANHPNSRIYNTLASLVEFDGFYLESEPCLACNSPEVPYARMKLDAIKAETKYTDNRILVKCIGSHTIQSVTMNVHEPRRSKSVRVLNLYYNNRVVADLSELRNNSSAWKRAKSCNLNFGQTELKVEFPIPITACNFMIELDCFYENLQAASMESLQCPRCSRLVTDKHGICGNCHENAYQCRQCRNINYENLDSFLCNECGYSKYGRFEFNFMAKPSYVFDRMENDEDMRKGLAAIEAESENAHKKYQQLLGYKKPLLKLVSSVGEAELDSQQKEKDSLHQQLIVPLPGAASFKVNRKIAILGVLYGEKCKMAFDSVSKSVQTLQGLRRVLMSYLERKKSPGATATVVAHRHPNHCYGCANTFVGHCLGWLQILSKVQYCRQQLVGAGVLAELFENNIHQGPRMARVQARNVLCAFTEADSGAVTELNNLIKQKVMYCLEHHRSMDVAACVRDELQLLSETCALSDEFWEGRLRVVFQLLFRSIQVGARHPVIAEYIILPCLRIVAQACTPPKSEVHTGSEIKAEDATTPKPMLPEPAPVTPSKEKDKEADSGGRNQDLLLVNYSEWRNGATYLDFVRRQYTIAQTGRPVQKLRKDTRRADSVALKYILRWKRRACKQSVTDELRMFEDSSWVRELALSACSQPIRQEMCSLIEVLCAQSIVQKAKFLDLLMGLLAATKAAGESAAEYFELLFKMIEPEEARLYLTVRGFLGTACGLITEEVVRVEAQERSFQTDISQGYILHKLIELLNKFLQVPNIRNRFMKESLLSQVLEALLVIRGLVVQKTKLISDCGRLLRELLDNLLQESYDNKRHFIRACVSGLQVHHQNRNRRSLFVLEQLCNIICPTKPEPVYMLVLNKAHTQEEFIRGSMTKNPYSSMEVGPLMRDVKNKICQQLELLGLIEDDYGMELLVAGNIISLDLTIVLVYEQVWRKAQGLTGSSLLISPGMSYPPMTVTYRLQGLDGEATEPMIKELDDDREETQDPEVEFAITGVMNECGGLAILVKIVQEFTDEELRSNQEQIALVLKLLMFCCKIRKNREALLQLGALDVLLETARRAFSSESVQALLHIIEYLVSEANESDIGVAEDGLSSSTARGEQAAKGVLMFLERLFNSSSTKSSKQQHRNADTVARILPYLTFGEPAAMEVLVDHFVPYLDWHSYDKLQKQFSENTKDTVVAQKASQHQLALDNFVKMTESIKLNVFGERLKDLIVEKQIVSVATKYLKDVFPVTEGKDYKASADWNQGLELASVPIVLSMLRGLARGHRMTQECLDSEGVLALVHALEGVSGDNEVGFRAETLLDTLSDKESTGEGFLGEKISSLRDATRDEMRRRALQRREELLQGMGMRRELGSDGGERIIASHPSIEGLDELEEEEAGLSCMVCREGYKLRPTDMLGTYSYSKRVNIGPTSAAQGRAEWAYTTVSHFNVIHFQCHLEAKRADATLKNPKKEWEGAALRNNETLCNNLFPLRGPAVPLAQYIRCVDSFWDHLNALGRADGSRLRLLTYDIVLMLGRFATGASFSTDCKGGGKESNSRLLPFMLQMARHLMDQQGLSQRRLQAKALQTYLAPESEAAPAATTRTPSPSTPQRPSSEDSVQFMMLQSVLLQSYEEWEQHRKAFLRRGAAHAYVLHRQGRSMLPASPMPSSDTKRPQTPESATSAPTPSSSGLSSEQLFNILKPMLVYIGIIEQVQRYLKGGATRVATKGEDSSGFGGAEPWEMSMKEKLRDVTSMLGFSKELLEWLDEMQGSLDLQEALDVMGVLVDVLSGGNTSCDAFFLSAIGEKA